jgi:hypothetical protein
MPEYLGVRAASRRSCHIEPISMKESEHETISCLSHGSEHVFARHSRVCREVVHHERDEGLLARWNNDGRWPTTSWVRHPTARQIQGPTAKWRQRSANRQIQGRKAKWVQWTTRRVQGPTARWIQGRKARWIQGTKSKWDRRPKTGYTAKSVHGRFEKERQELIVSELEGFQIRIEANEEDGTPLHGRPRAIGYSSHD